MGYGITTLVLTKNPGMIAFIKAADPDHDGTKSGGHGFCRSALKPMRLFFLLLCIVFAGFSGEAQADWRCSNVITSSEAGGSSGTVVIDLGADRCSTTNTTPTGDYISFVPGEDGEVKITFRGGSTASFSNLTITRNGVSTGIDMTSQSSQESYECSSGCTISGNYNGNPINGRFSITYTQNDGSGPVTVAAPEIEVTSNGAGIADGGTHAQGAKAAGVPVTLIYRVRNAGTDTLTLGTVSTSGSPPNVSVSTTVAL